MNDSERIICRDADQLAQAAARRISQWAAQSILERGQLAIALAGGSTPARTYRLLAHGVGETNIDWSKTWLFFGDERCVPHEDERSNYRMVRDTLLGPASIAPDHVISIPTLSSSGESARDYAATLQQFFHMSASQLPVFDVILLGLGDDGHTASLFPHAAALNVVDVPVTSSPPGTLPPPVDRVTLTYPVLNSARHVMFLVSGESKAVALADVWGGHADAHDRPAAGVRPAGTLTWLVDQAAAPR